ncbi:galactosyltransferase-related protein [Pedobacter endophyticus]|uniref:Galactosyltransferase C-terminal domain-containing protein n=1 Tax=Pedobacter endophyticus TaxID=2789740 RepID=A0A7S9PYS0_9SPHI|nr:galactosyltransferase-related protein [Pedobacter endophyticus]QPH38946.1 hypothetical protein IZT61_18060 [Pedobacter endophyticus]
MIFISAQPDDFYFLWQLQLQLHNFNRLGIQPESIHVLIAHPKGRGLSSFFKEFIAVNKQASFYSYVDERVSKRYLSSVRPHILAKHFEENKYLEKEDIFYHDSDIIFKRIPDFSGMLKNETWYAADTRSYTGVTYIKQTANEEVFQQMCDLVGVKSNLIEDSDKEAGGAQYLLKNVPASFWQKLEMDSERLFVLLSTYNSSFGFCDSKNKIQAWCADMWCLWWQAILIGKQIEIHPELGFNWAHSSISLEKRNNIIHYTGSLSDGSEKLFRKNNYSNCSPFYDDLEQIDQNTSSYSVVKEIRDYNRKHLADRIDLNDTSFLIPVRIDSHERLENVYIVCRYLHLYFDSHILLIEADNASKINRDLLPENVRYHFIRDENPTFHRTKYNNMLIKLAATPYIALYDTDVVFPISQIVSAVTSLRKNECQMAYPYDGHFFGVDILMKAMFSKMLDPNIFDNNLGKLSAGSERSFGGCAFLNKTAYASAGMENEYLTSWGPDDVERWKRMLLLGYNIKRFNGNLYHLPHPRTTNSGYCNSQARVNLVNEYLKVCSMEKHQLELYIKTWKWK